MSDVHTKRCDQCGAIIPERAAYTAHESRRVAVASKVDACSRDCAVKLTEALWGLIERQVGK